MLDIGATCHMTGAWEIFKSFKNLDLNMHVELGVGTKHSLKGTGTIPFHMELGSLLRVMNVLWVPKLKRSVLSVSLIEKNGFDIAWSG
jgi:hypothetical protein